MDENLKKIIPFLKPYKTNVIMNVTFNILYALFSTLSFIALIPMLDVLFNIFRNHLPGLDNTVKELLEVILDAVLRCHVLFERHDGLRW